MARGIVSVIPTHAPCDELGAKSGLAFAVLGELDTADLSAVCQRIVLFEDCRCKVLARQKDPIAGRGDEKCGRCAGRGVLVVQQLTGCGRKSQTCPGCGLRARWDDGPCLACNPQAGAVML